MYTQCPECSTAFKVTAAVLKQAAGKVRCGGCGSAFNALAHLSEEKPASRPPEPPAEPSLPELKPEPLEATEPPPTAISPEQSAALLKTLDELAGSDIRLEDTGIEWRLLDDDEAEEATDAQGAGLRPTASLLDEELSADLESRRVDEVLSNTPTPVDEYLPAAGDTAVESPEVFDEAASRTVPDEVLRFDDNTGLPDEFDDETGERPVVVPEPTREAPEPMADQEVDLGFDDPDEWLDLLGEVAPESEAESPAEPGEADIVAELEALEPVVADDDGAGDRGDGDAADDELVSRMEALSLELSGIQEELDELSGNHGILADADAASPVEDGEASADEDEAPVLEADDDDDAEAPDEFVLAADDDDETRVSAADETEDVDENVDEDDVIVLEADDEVEDEDDSAIGDFVLPGDDEPWAEQDDTGLEAGDGQDEDALAFEIEAGTGEQDDEALVADGDSVADADDDGDEDGTSIDDDLLAAAFEAESVIRQAEPAVPVVPPLTEEEQTINMMIDQDLLSIAIEDEDGFASTIVGDKASFDAALAEAEAAEAEAAAGIDEDGLPVETIIMEGAVARSAVDEARADALKEEAAKLVAEANDGEQPEPPKRNWRLVAGIVALTLLLAVQAVHFSRDSLARIPAIYDLLAPVYQRIGMPLTPAWEVTGWRFEATRGSTDESGETLSIFTRIGNESDAALPYPVISVSLTDRFEEPIGSRIFEPPDYLAADVDTRRMVAAGSNFDALMAIESPSDAATGYKLNVCYRLTGDRLRCAIEDFQ